MAGADYFINFILQILASSYLILVSKKTWLGLAFLLHSAGRIYCNLEGLNTTSGSSTRWHTIVQVSH